MAREDWDKMLGHIPRNLKTMISAYSSYTKVQKAKTLIDPRVKKKEAQKKLKWAQKNLAEAKKNDDSDETENWIWTVKTYEEEINKHEGRIKKLKNKAKQENTTIDELLVPKAAREVPQYLLDHHADLVAIYDKINLVMKEASKEDDTPYGHGYQYYTRGS